MKRVSVSVNAPWNWFKSKDPEHPHELFPWRREHIKLLVLCMIMESTCKVL